MIHSSILWKSTHFARYIRKLCFWGLRNRHPYRGSEIGWPFCRENSRVKSRIFDRGGQKWGVHLCVTLHGAIENRQDPYSGHAVWGMKFALLKLFGNMFECKLSNRFFFTLNVKKVNTVLMNLLGWKKRFPIAWRVYSPERGFVPERIKHTKQIAHKGHRQWVHCIYIYIYI